MPFAFTALLQSRATDSQVEVADLFKVIELRLPLDDGLSECHHLVARWPLLYWPASTQQVALMLMQRCSSGVQRSARRKGGTVALQDEVKR